MQMLKPLFNLLKKNRFDRLLVASKNSGHQKFLVCWNRGLGDIPLGLYALTKQIHKFIPGASVTFLTRKDLAPGFELLGGVSVLVNSQWKRGNSYDLDLSLEQVGAQRKDFDVILEHPDPTRWLQWQLGKLTPRLQWKPEWDALSISFSLPKEPLIGVHVQTETSYSYEKNWPTSHWNDFFLRATRDFGAKIVLFGFSPFPSFEGNGIIDLRGKTTLFEMLSIIKNCCKSLLVPDSGILSITYYIDSPFPIQVVSLWADPNQGVLKQGVSSPNPLLRHHQLIAEEKNLSTVSVAQVINTLFLNVEGLH